MHHDPDHGKQLETDELAEFMEKIGGASVFQQYGEAG
jgi:hypothetical protein